MPDITIPQARKIVVDTTGAQIVQEESPETRDSRGIYLPHYIEAVSHIAIDIGGSLAKVVYFTRSSKPISTTPPARDPTSPFLPPSSSSLSSPPPPPLSSSSSSSTLPGPSGSYHTTASANGASQSLPETAPRRPAVNGALTPGLLTEASSPPNHHSSPLKASLASISSHPKLRRSSLPAPLPGGLLNFARFETSAIEELISFLKDLIATSAVANRVSLEKMKRNVKVMATGGGAHMYYDLLHSELEVEVLREEEMECLILGLGFFTRVPEEVFWLGEELVYKVSHPESSTSSTGPRPLSIPPNELPRPSPTPPTYQVTFAPAPTSLDEAIPHFPCLVVNIGSGVSIVKCDADGKFERVSGTSLGGGTLWGLLSLLTDAKSFDDMLALSELGDNAAVDMLVGDIYGSDYSKIGLKSSTIASTFGKVFRRGATADERKRNLKQEDIAKSLLYAVSNNIGHVAYMNAAKYGLDRVFFGGCFIRGHAATISTLSYAIRFWSKGTMRACFLRHEGFL
ncbi:fumble-domain-containing protein [Kockovaella imperatae]|uniref:Fumble-domain-containing protein n=1 Tax=Kockovaella imperatae TaxID=4999 RepID=A0A1Y1US36_9TREE|nr:fumble-domain-containing protein [Kockovaella imperatae]ORX40304.1 fumble-domain-containing protein [Kockovaella imperatae]